MPQDPRHGETPTDADWPDGRVDTDASASPTVTATDPTDLVDRDDVEYLEKPTETHQSHYDLYEPIAGMAVAGVTDDAGAVLLLVKEHPRHAMLPHGRVYPDDDFATVARRAVRERTGVTVEIDAPERVRRKTYRTEGGENATTTGYDVVFGASPVGSEAPADGSDGDWTVGWYDEPSVDPAEGNDVVSDILLFLD